MLAGAIMRALGVGGSQHLCSSSRPVCFRALRLHTAAKTVARPRIRADAGAVSTPTAVGSKQLDQLVKARQTLEAHSPYGLLHIKGVTFEGRQEAVKKLAPGQPVMLVKEPSNPYDPLAVQIKTLDGHMLGHVSKEVNRFFPLQITFGTVYSVGMGTSGNWGSLVSYCARLPGLSLEFLPQGWSEQIDFQKILGAEEWELLQQQCTAQHNNTCAITSSAAVPNSAALQVIPRWCFDYNKRQVALAGFMPVDATLAHAHEVLDISSSDPAERQEAMRVVSRIMNWLDAETAKFVAFAEQQRQQVEQEGWELEQITRTKCLQLVPYQVDDSDEGGEQLGECDDEFQGGVSGNIEGIPQHTYVGR
eukprot:GHUV01003945.1.p1 GENE.GHUV01003945.1~~GHUV01003945.1.p1  ORF type:complete len:362 (+),score=74.37 GHUV01003945.1:189-1274(+)